MKTTVVVIISFWIFVGATCSVKKELKALQDLKAECENLEVELGGLGAEKLTPVIDKKVSQCTEHGFWLKKVKKKKQNSLDW